MNSENEDSARRMRAAILAVRQLHRPVKPHSNRFGSGIEICNACSSVGVLIGKSAGIAYPCTTIRVLDAAGAD